MSAAYRSLFDRAGIRYARFMRTTEPHHVAVVRRAWQQLEASGDIFLGRHEGWYCTAEEAFIPQGQVEQKRARDGSVTTVNAVNGLPVAWHSEENFLFRLSRYQQQVRDWLIADPSVVQPAARYAEVMQLLAEPLPELSVSRLTRTAPWGITVPVWSAPERTADTGMRQHSRALTVCPRVYVIRFDALLNYLSACCPGVGFAAPLSSSVSALWPPDVQVVGKDILKFHAVYWPALLLALRLPLPRRLLAHGHWTVGGKKMSKSLHNVVDPLQLLDRLGVDALRYAMLRGGHYGDDSDWDDNNALRWVNGELAHTLGNLLSRCCSAALLQANALPSPPAPTSLKPQDQTAIAQLGSLRDAVTASFTAMEFGAGIFAVQSALRSLNAYFDAERPWLLVKEDRDRLHTVLFVCLEGVRLAALLLQPILPDGCTRVLDRLAVPLDERTFVHAQSAA
jgi:methionyl-tRNA synthetase